MSASQPLGEFDLIARYFQRAAPLRHAALGVGDDCALLHPPAGEVLALSTDTLVAGHHFFDDIAPAALGHKALAVNLSDLAASGAQPLAFLLALTLPTIDDAWLQALARSLFALADASDCELIGGDTTRGPLSLTITVLGSIPAGQALLRSGARAGDDIYVSHGAQQGLGDARLALHLLQILRGQPPAHGLETLDAARQDTLLQACRKRLERPEPRTALGLALRGVASACLDLSDGLQGDLRHILQASGVGATLQVQNETGDGLFAATSCALRSLGPEMALSYALAGGDDYELLFTAPVTQRTRLAQVAQQTGLQLTRVGRIDPLPGLRLQHADGSQTPIGGSGFDHFATI